MASRSVGCRGHAGDECNGAVASSPTLRGRLLARASALATHAACHVLMAF